MNDINLKIKLEVKIVPIDASMRETVWLNGIETKLAYEAKKASYEVEKILQKRLEELIAINPPPTPSN